MVDDLIDDKQKVKRVQAFLKLTGHWDGDLDGQWNQNVKDALNAYCQTVAPGASYSFRGRNAALNFVYGELIDTEKRVEIATNALEQTGDTQFHAAKLLYPYTEVNSSNVTACLNAASIPRHEDYDEHSQLNAESRTQQYVGTGVDGGWGQNTRGTSISYLQLHGLDEKEPFKTIIEDLGESRSLRGYVEDTVVYRANNYRLLTALEQYVRTKQEQTLGATVEFESNNQGYSSTPNDNVRTMQGIINQHSPDLVAVTGVINKETSDAIRAYFEEHFEETGSYTAPNEEGRRFLVGTDQITHIQYMQLGRAIAENTGIRNEPYIQELVESLSKEMVRIERAKEREPRIYSTPTGMENGVTSTTYTDADYMNDVNALGTEETAEIITPRGAEQTADVVLPQGANELSPTFTADEGDLTTQTAGLADEQTSTFERIQPTIMPTGEWTITVQKTGERTSVPRLAKDGSPDGDKPIALGVIVVTDPSGATYTYDFQSGGYGKGPLPGSDYTKGSFDYELDWSDAVFLSNTDKGSPFEDENHTWSRLRIKDDEALMRGRDAMIFHPDGGYNADWQDDPAAPPIGQFNDGTAGFIGVRADQATAFFQLLESIPKDQRPTHLTVLPSQHAPDLNIQHTDLPLSNKDKTYQIQAFLDLQGYDPNGIDGQLGHGMATAFKRYADAQTNLPADIRTAANELFEKTEPGRARVTSEINALREQIHNYVSQTVRGNSGLAKTLAATAYEDVKNGQNPERSQALAQMIDPTAQIKIDDRVEGVTHVILIETSETLIPVIQNAAPSQNDDPSLSPTALSEAEQKDEIYQVQSFLYLNGHDPNGIDGIMGSGTQGAIDGYVEAINNYFDYNPNLLVGPLRDALYDANTEKTRCDIDPNRDRTELKHLQSKLAILFHDHISGRLTQDQHLRSDIAHRALSIYEDNESDGQNKKLAQATALLLDPTKDITIDDTVEAQAKLILETEAAKHKPLTPLSSKDKTYQIQSFLKLQDYDPNGIDGALGHGLAKAFRGYVVENDPNNAYINNLAQQLFDKTAPGVTRVQSEIDELREQIQAYVVARTNNPATRKELATRAQASLTGRQYDLQDSKAVQAMALLLDPTADIKIDDDLQGNIVNPILQTEASRDLTTQTLTHLNGGTNDVALEEEINPDAAAVDEYLARYDQIAGDIAYLSTTIQPDRTAQNSISSEKYVAMLFNRATRGMTEDNAPLINISEIDDEEDLRDEFEDTNALSSARGLHRLETGDVVFFNKDRDATEKGQRKRSDRLGIVSAINEETGKVTVYYPESRGYGYYDLSTFNSANNALREDKGIEYIGNTDLFLENSQRLTQPAAPDGVKSHGNESFIPESQGPQSLPFIDPRKRGN